MELSTIETATFTERCQQTGRMEPDELAKLSPYDLFLTCLAWRDLYRRGTEMRRYHAESAERESNRRITEAAKNQRRIAQISDMLTEARQAQYEAEQRAARMARLEARLAEQGSAWGMALTMAERDYAEAYREAESGGVRTPDTDRATSRRILCTAVVGVLDDLKREALTPAPVVPASP